MIVASTIPTTPVVGPVALEYVQIPTRSKAGITSIALTFSGALNASTAVALGNYRLATAGKGWVVRRQGGPDDRDQVRDL